MQIVLQAAPSTLSRLLSSCSQSEIRCLELVTLQPFITLLRRCHGVKVSNVVVTLEIVHATIVRTVRQHFVGDALGLLILALQRL